jgi:hypothetical protein
MHPREEAQLAANLAELATSVCKTLTLVQESLTGVSVGLMIGLTGGGLYILISHLYSKEKRRRV